MLTATQKDVTAIADLIEDLCGIYLDDTKGYLVETRLSSLAEQYGCEDFVELADKGKSFANQDLRRDLVNLMTTNETLFFRDSTPFEAMRHKLLPELIDRRESSPFPTRLRIWSAACSTGQEAYSVAMTLCELIPEIDSWDISIVGTDISDDVVAEASRGVYSEHMMSRGATEMRHRHFQQVVGGWQVSDRLRSMVKFEKANLLEPFDRLGKFDIILCRNVAIYFKDDVRRDLFRRIHQRLNPDGHLIIGSAESLVDMSDVFNAEFHCGATIYNPV